MLNKNKKIVGSAKINYLNNNLSEQQINLANWNSFDGNRGSNTKREYESYRSSIEFSNLTTTQKNKLLDKLYKLYQPILAADAKYVSVIAAGPARYPTEKMRAISERRINASNDLIEWWKSIEPTLNSVNIKQSKISKKSNNDENIEKKKELVDDFNYWFNREKEENIERKKKYGVANYRMSEYVLNRMINYPDLYSKCFEKLNKEMNYRKNTNLFKYYNSISNGSVTQQTIDEKIKKNNQILYSCSDYTVKKTHISAGDRIAISFTLKPKPQLIYALKRRGFVWHGDSWICKPEKYDESWIKSISTQYEKYL